MSEFMSVTNSPKTSTFQMRINPEIKEQVENIYARCGMTLTDAINIFIQQSI
ncbi:MAG: type II toxin-antitoxin system RelB/DinJ family antitoxin, partial [Clostridia bacterium]|nr:type II toxin-antitoxin system RelB/DinJ family antitoxin [Clostridia bacterium]